MAGKDILPFSVVLEALLDERKPFPPAHLHRFSDIQPGDLRALKRVWPQVPVVRRRAILDDLEGISEADTLVSFHDFAVYTMQDEDAQVRQRSIQLLWEDEGTSLIPIFTSSMQSDPDHLVRAAAATGLGIFIYLGELEEILPEKFHAVEESLLAVASGSEHAEVRRRALEALGFSSRPEVTALIQEAYHQGSPDWIASALFAMGRSADQRWQRQVLDNLDHLSASVRMEAVRAAGELEIKSARQAIITSAYKDEDSGVRYAAIWALSQIGGDRVQSLLERMLEDAQDDEEVQVLEEALDNLSFTNDMENYNLIELDEDMVEEPDELADDMEDE